MRLNKIKNSLQLMSNMFTHRISELVEADKSKVCFLRMHDLSILSGFRQLSDSYKQGGTCPDCFAVQFVEALRVSGVVR